MEFSMTLSCSKVKLSQFYHQSKNLNNFLSSSALNRVIITGLFSLLFVESAYAGPKTSYNSTGSDQNITAPANAEGVKVKVWGAAGGHEVAGSLPSGAGGYTEAEFDYNVVSPGASFTIVVGEGGNKSGRVPDGVQSGVYGFGSVSNHEQGGGLSGFFTGSSVVSSTSNARALVIAGGGGGAEHSGSNNGTVSGNGNSPSSGGESTFLGSTDTDPGGICIAANSGATIVPAQHAGGGGGFQGGGRLPSPLGYSFGPYNTPACAAISGAAGGSGFIAASAISSSLQFTPDGNIAAPNASDPDYITGRAQGTTSSSAIAGGDGLVVIEWLLPEFDLRKTAVVNDVDGNGPDAGDTVTFTFNLENTGDFTLTNAGIAADTFQRADGTPLSYDGSGIQFISSTGAYTPVTPNLAVGETATFAATYTIVFADAGTSFGNTATATGTSPKGTLISDVSDNTGGDGTDGPDLGSGSDEGNRTDVSIPAPPPINADVSITKTNTPGVNAELDQANDTLTSGQSTTYTLVVTNNGPDDVTGAVVTDSPTSGLTCVSTDPVTMTGDGVPAGSYTIANLTGAGITLGTLADTQFTTLTYSCEVN